VFHDCAVWVRPAAAAPAPRDATETVAATAE
jgi:hypothetical protein